MQQEQGNRLGHLQLMVEEKDHDLKSIQGDLVIFHYAFQLSEMILENRLIG